MRNLTAKELDFVTKCPFVLGEDVGVVHEITEEEKISNQYDEMEPFFDKIYIGETEKTLREIHKTAYQWAKENENAELIEEVITSYCPIKINDTNKNDIKTIINTATK